MAVVKGITFTETIPHEPENSMTFRRLSWKQLEKAAEIRRKKILNDYGEFMDKIPQGATSSGEDLEQYDKDEILKNGIVSWTYPEEVSPENIELLDEETADWAYKILTEAHKPKDTARKKGS